MQHELVFYIINSNDTHGCPIGFAVRDYAARETSYWLDGAIVQIMVFNPDDENPSMWCIFHHISVMHPYAVVLFELILMTSD